MFKEYIRNILDRRSRKHIGHQHRAAGRSITWLGVKGRPLRWDGRAERNSPPERFAYYNNTIVCSKISPDSFVSLTQILYQTQRVYGLSWILLYVALTIRDSWYILYNIIVMSTSPELRCSVHASVKSSRRLV